MKVWIAKEYPDAIIPSRAHPQDAGWDIFSYKDYEFEPFSKQVVQIGIRIVVESGYYYSFASRSGLAFDEDFVVSHHNVMDAGYTGNCGVLMWNRSSKKKALLKSHRFCQVIFHKVPSVEMLVMEDLNDLPALYGSIKGRQSEGFGSTGD